MNLHSFLMLSLIVHDIYCNILNTAPEHDHSTSYIEYEYKNWLIHLRFTFVLRSITLRPLETLSRSPFLSTYEVKVIEKMEELLHLSFDEKWWSACNHFSSIRISHIQNVLHFDARIEEVEKIDGNIICLVRGACPSWFDLIFRLHWCPKHVKDGGILQQPEKSSAWTYKSLWMLYILYHI